MLNRELLTEKTAKILEAYALGVSVETIKRIYDIGNRQLYNLLKLHGLMRRRQKLTKSGTYVR